MENQCPGLLMPFALLALLSNPIRTLNARIRNICCCTFVRCCNLLLLFLCLVCVVLYFCWFFIFVVLAQHCGCLHVLDERLCIKV